MQKIINTIQISNIVEQKLIVLVAIYILLNFATDVIQLLYDYYDFKFEAKLNLYFSEKILHKSSKLSLKEFESSETYNLLKRAQSEGGEKIKLYLSLILGIFSNIISTISYAYILYTFNKVIFALIFIIPLINFYISNKFNIKNFNIQKSRTNDRRKSWYLSHIITYGNFYKELKIFNLFNHFIESFKKLYKKFNKEDIELYKNRSFMSGISIILENIIDGGIIVYIVFSGINNIIYIGNMITLLNTVSTTKNSISTILMYISDIYRENLFIEQMFLFLNLDEESIGDIKITKINKIEFKNVSYKYDKSSNHILKNISFTVSSKEKIAIVGQNGSGKTTLMKLLMGFYHDYGGTILVNGIDLRLINKKSLQSRISAVFQDFSKYESTLKENIIYGDINCDVYTKKLSDLVNKMELERLIDSLPMKIDTTLGSWFDNAVNISAGQWQKIALSRGFFKDADIYFLDEPNSALDIISEQKFDKFYNSFISSKIGIIISHNFNGLIKTADKIIVIDNGKIDGIGKHETLLKDNLLYEKMYMASKKNIKE